MLHRSKIWNDHSHSVVCCRPGRYLHVRIESSELAGYLPVSRCPWTLYKSSATFGSYLGAYGVLLSCVAGPMITDYWLVRRGHYRINDLYTTDRGGWYWYTAGINWRAYAAYFWCVLLSHLHL